MLWPKISLPPEVKCHLSFLVGTKNNVSQCFTVDHNDIFDIV